MAAEVARLVLLGDRCGHDGGRLGAEDLDPAPGDALAAQRRELAQDEALLAAVANAAEDARNLTRHAQSDRERERGEVRPVRE